MKRKLALSAFAAAGTALTVAFIAPSASAVAAQPGTAVAKAATKSVSVQATKRASIACSKPRGNTTNYSWATGSNDSTTVYFNNHCSHAVSAKLTFRSGDGDTNVGCMTTNGGTKGKKRFTITRYQLESIKKGC